MRKRSHAPSHLEDTPAESAMQNVADMPRENGEFVRYSTLRRRPDDAAIATGQSARSVNPAIARRDERFAEKRWIISPTIIQDDTPLAPPIGPNVNILGSESSDKDSSTPEGVLILHFQARRLFSTLPLPRW